MRNNLNNPKLRFTPTAWAKLLFLRDYGSTEIGGFGICPNDPLLIEYIVLPEQRCTCTTVEFDDNSVAGIFDDQVDRGLRPEQFARIWIHTHPGNSAEPSMTDIHTFSRVFGNADWSVMFILACGGDSYCRLRTNVGPGCEALLETEIEYSDPFQGSECLQWENEYSESVFEIEPIRHRRNNQHQDALFGTDSRHSIFDDELWLNLDEQENHFDNIET